MVIGSPVSEVAMASSAAVSCLRRRTGTLWRFVLLEGGQIVNDGPDLVEQIAEELKAAVAGLAGRNDQAGARFGAHPFFSIDHQNPGAGITQALNDVQQFG